MKALSTGPLSRKELVGAVEKAGYVFSSKNPLNSLGSVLYAKNSPIKSRAGKFYLEGGLGTEPVSDSEGAAAPAGRKRRRMSAEARAKIAAAQKARWAKQKRKA